jgi:hypothetical protein
MTFRHAENPTTNAQKTKNRKRFFIKRRHVPTVPQKVNSFVPVPPALTAYPNAGQGNASGIWGNHKKHRRHKRGEANNAFPGGGFVIRTRFIRAPPTGDNVNNRQ